jgi:hypothetical protein
MSASVLVPSVPLEASKVVLAKDEGSEVVQFLIFFIACPIYVLIYIWLT